MFYYYFKKNGQLQKTFITASHKTDTSSEAEDDARAMGPLNRATAAIPGFYAPETGFIRKITGYFRGMCCFRVEDVLIQLVLCGERSLLLRKSPSMSVADVVESHENAASAQLNMYKTYYYLS